MRVVICLTNSTCYFIGCQNLGSIGGTGILFGSFHPNFPHPSILELERGMEKRKEDEQEKVIMKEDEHTEVKMNIKLISDYSIFGRTYVIEEFG